MRSFTLPNPMFFFTTPSCHREKNQLGNEYDMYPNNKKIQGKPITYCRQPTIDIPIDIQSVEYLLSFDVFFSEKKTLGVFHGWKSPTAITFFSKGKWSKTKPPGTYVPCWSSRWLVNGGFNSKPFISRLGSFRADRTSSRTKPSASRPVERMAAASYLRAISFWIG